MRNDIIKVDIFVSPLKVMDDSLVSKLLLYNEKVLEEVYDALIDIEVIEFGNHCLLVLQILLVLVAESISFINDASNIVKDLCISMSLQV